MARPSKTDDKLNQAVSFRLSTKDYLVYNEKVSASGMSPSAFFRECVLANKTQVSAHGITQTQRELLYLVNLACKSLEALAERVKSHGENHAIDQERYVKIIEELAEIQRLLKRSLTNAYSN